MIDRYAEVMSVIKDGELGLNKGIRFTINKLTDHLGGITQNTQYLIMGKSKTGKSRFGYDNFIFSPIEYLYSLKVKGADPEEYPFDILAPMFSFEIPAVSINLIAICRFLYINHGVLTHPKYIVGKFGKAEPELYDMVYSPEVEDYIKFFNSRVSYFTVATPDWIWKYVYSNCIKISHEIGRDESNMPKFKFNNSKLRMHVLLDHLSLVQQAKGFDLKRTIDATSNYFFQLKNTFPITTAILQQINPQDRKDDRELVLPDHENLRDTKTTFQDADVVMSLGAPYHLNRHTFNFNGEPYYIMPEEANGFVGLEDRFRIVGVVKDRDGASNVISPAAYIGEIGAFMDIAGPNYVDENNRSIYDIYDFKRTYG